VSHERIYQYVYADKRRGGTLHRHLRCRRVRRKRYGTHPRRGQIPNRVSIEARPKVVDAKRRIGDWEADTIVGAGRRCAILSLVERKSKLVRLRKVGRKAAGEVARAGLALLSPLSRCRSNTGSRMGVSICGQVVGSIEDFTFLCAGVSGRLDVVAKRFKTSSPGGMRRMSHKVFYSWQSDLPDETNRVFIERALHDASRVLAGDGSAGVEVVIDRDTMGVPGSPDITETVLAKIKQSEVVVCDVSIVTQGAGGRLMPNSNVMYELGRADETLGPGRVILVMNDAFGRPESLPFDVRNRRVITYRVPLGKANRAKERRRLASALAENIRMILTAAREQTSAVTGLAAPDASKAGASPVIKRSYRRAALKMFSILKAGTSVVYYLRPGKRPRLTPKAVGLAFVITALVSVVASLLLTYINRPPGLPARYRVLSFAEGDPGGPGDGSSVRSLGKKSQSMVGEILVHDFTLKPSLPLRGMTEGLTMTFFLPPDSKVADINNLQINLSNLKDSGPCRFNPGGTATWRVEAVKYNGADGLAFDIPQSFFTSLISSAGRQLPAGCDLKVEDLNLVGVSLSSTKSRQYVPALDAVLVGYGQSTYPSSAFGIAAPDVFVRLSYLRREGET